MPSQNQVLVDKALELACHDRAAKLQQAADDHEAVAGPHHAAETDFFQPAETDHPFHQFELVADVAGQLGRGLAHDDPGHQRQARHVPPHPKLARPQVLVAHADVSARGLHGKSP